MAFITTFYDYFFKKDSFDVQKTTVDKEQVITITCYNRNNDIAYSIWLDKSTAIKFAKTLRTEINKITTGEEANNE